MQNHDKKEKIGVAHADNNAPSLPLNQSVKGLSIVRLSLTSSGYKHDSKEVKAIDELIKQHSK